MERPSKTTRTLGKSAALRVAYEAWSACTHPRPEAAPRSSASIQAPPAQDWSTEDRDTTAVPPMRATPATSSKTPEFDASFTPPRVGSAQYQHGHPFEAAHGSRQGVEGSLAVRGR